MKLRHTYIFFCFLALLLLGIFSACRKKEEKLPLLTTIGAQGSGPTEGIGTGHLYASGDEEVTAKGFCWSRSPEPDLDDPHSDEGAGEGAFSSKMTNLLQRTQYYARAYASSALGTTYGKVYTFTTSLNAMSSMTDVEGNVYPTIQIGDQIWMAENLRVTKFRNGDPITNLNQLYYWNPYSTPLYCWYFDQISHKPDYGALYNWYAMTDVRNIAPVGWHVPTASEWQKLLNRFPNPFAAGHTLKHSDSKYWGSSYKGIDTCGFGALPGGYRTSMSSPYREKGNYAFFWTASSSGTFGSSVRIAYHDEAVPVSSEKWLGYSVRLVKD